jgi:cytochrome P450
MELNDRMNQVLRGNTLCSDGAEHDALRDVLRRPLTPRALRPVREQITAEAEHVVDTLVARGSFDAATELADYLPVSVVSNLVGLPVVRLCATCDGRGGGIRRLRRADLLRGSFTGNFGRSSASNDPRFFAARAARRVRSDQAW